MPTLDPPLTMELARTLLGIIGLLAVALLGTRLLHRWADANLPENDPPKDEGHAPWGPQR